VPLNPFRYPQSRYRRKLSPPSTSDYSRYKPFLKQEFMSQCVYCRLPDGLKGEDSFSVDHYRPQSKFPDLVTTYVNLFYACSGCNRRKGAFWPTDAQWRAKQFIPNPCDHVMFEHLRYRSARVETKSPAGELAEQVLMLNDERSVEYRELVLSVIAVLEEKKCRVQETIRRIDRQLSASPKQAERLSEEKAAAERDLARLEHHLSRAAGGVPL
jgi:HNH endonuclease